MKILALDIGAGTEDILLYDNSKKIENCIKMVLPSPSLLYAEKVREYTKARKNLLIEGDTIGGGDFASALINHIEEGLRVLMTRKAAYSIRNNLQQIKDLGVEIVKKTSIFNNICFEKLIIEEINLEKIKRFLSNFNENMSDIDMIAIAVQDHGISAKNISNRKSRILLIKKILRKQDGKIEALCFIKENIPTSLLRMRSASEAIRRQIPKTDFLIMDTAVAAIAGCLYRLNVKNTEIILLVNVGNGHTMATIVSNNKILGLIEHHTELLNPKKLNTLLSAFCDGSITDEEVYNDGGHGLFFLQKPPGISKISKFIATGPNREILENTNIRFEIATPAGDVMMTGPIGLVEIAKKKIRVKHKRHKLFDI